MTWLRPRGGPADALPALLLLLLLWPPATRGMICPAPTSVEHADIRVKSYTVHSRERYVCNTGFKRKAGTSSLTECVFNNTTNTTHWTTPNLKCIRDPSLAQKKLPPSTAATAGVTPQPETPSPSGKGPTGTGRHTSPQAPSQTTAGTPQGTPSASHQPPDANPSSSRDVIMSSISVVMLCVLIAVLPPLCRMIRSRQTPRRRHSVEIETVEALPMNNSREEDDGETGPHNL
ncbi:interleukin-15 receptor subunit alpha isoform X1 [Nycticebus coucang]|uniref:interleukin-15 receptor subunit alpha isoform X1 n=1 Tax=Nycticebus coucang TaxID=9470 RepID=UPI00234C0789|nr:interleukin-15 receptor subunit alpha isoform X1 [Nycticebus coucang]